VRRLRAGALILMAAMGGLPLGVAQASGTVGMPAGSEMMVFVATWVGATGAWGCGWMLVAGPWRARRRLDGRAQVLRSLGLAALIGGLLLACGAAAEMGALLVLGLAVVLIGGGLAWPFGFGLVRRIAGESGDRRLAAAARTVRDCFVLVAALVFVVGVCVAGELIGSLGAVCMVAGLVLVGLWLHALVVRLERLAARVLRARGGE
jgi:hypothetical protein